MGDERRVFFDILGKIVAIIMVLTLLTLIVNENFPSFIPENVINILNYVTKYGYITLLGIVGCEAVSKSNIVIRILFIVAFAIIIISSFFPTLFAQMIDLIKPKN